MRQLKICRCQNNKFTIVMVLTNYEAFPYDGTFPDEYYYYRVDSEAELIEELNKEEELLDEAIETIYFGNEDVTEKYLKLTPSEYSSSSKYYKLLACWRKPETKDKENNNA